MVLTTRCQVNTHGAQSESAKHHCPPCVSQNRQDRKRENWQSTAYMKTATMTANPTETYKTLSLCTFAGVHQEQ
eukprot:1523618-Amphidinium_carterae.1